MDFVNLLGIATALAMDAFAVSIAAGTVVAPVTPRHIFRLAFHFGLFQAMMPVLGWFAGRELATHISAYGHWVAFGLLAFVSTKMLWESLRAESSDSVSDPTRGLMLVTLAVATSIDALAVGLSMAFMEVSIWLPSLVIGLVAAAFSGVGIAFGSRFGSKLGRWAELVGGCVLLLIGVRMLVVHLAG